MTSRSAAFRTSHSAVRSDCSSNGTMEAMSSESPVHALSTRLRAGESLRLGWCAMGAPSLGETLVRAGFDAALFDMQHGAFDATSAVLGISAVALAGKPALVRIPVGD